MEEKMKVVEVYLNWKKLKNGECLRKDEMTLIINKFN